MKNRFKKLSIVALSTVCLLANGQINAMEEGLESDLDSSSYQPFQMSPFVLQLSQILKLDQVQTAGLEKLSQQSPEEFGRSFLGMSGLGNSGLLGSSVQVPPEGREIKRLKASYEGTDLFPSVDPLKIMDLIHNILFPKYAQLLDNRFSTKSLDISIADYEDVLAFLNQNKHFIKDTEDGLVCEKSMILVLKMITQEFNILSHLSPYIQHWMHLGFSNKFSYRDIVGKRDGKFIVNLGAFYKGIEQQIMSLQNHELINHGMGNQDAQQTKNKILDTIRKDLNKKFSYAGFNFDIETDAKDVSLTIQNWVRVVHQLVSFELREWDDKLSSYRQLQESYDYASQQLLAAQSNQTLYFSGVVKTPYTIGLIQVEKAEQASSPEFLHKVVSEHKKMDEKKLNDYNLIKDEVSYLRKVKNWLDTFLDEVSKKGRIS